MKFGEGGPPPEVTPQKTPQNLGEEVIEEERNWGELSEQERIKALKEFETNWESEFKKLVDSAKEKIGSLWYCEGYPDYEMKEYRKGESAKAKKKCDNLIENEKEDCFNKLSKFLEEKGGSINNYENQKMVIDNARRSEITLKTFDKLIETNWKNLTLKEQLNFIDKGSVASKAIANLDLEKGDKLEKKEAEKRLREIALSRKYSSTLSFDAIEKLPYNKENLKIFQEIFKDDKEIFKDGERSFYSFRKDIIKRPFEISSTNIPETRSSCIIRKKLEPERDDKLIKKILSDKKVSINAKTACVEKLYNAKDISLIDNFIKDIKKIIEKEKIENSEEIGGFEYYPFKSRLERDASVALEIAEEKKKELLG